MVPTKGETFPWGRRAAQFLLLLKRNGRYEREEGQVKESILGILGMGPLTRRNDERNFADRERPAPCRKMMAA
jgi:hypothetical protein